MIKKLIILFLCFCCSTCVFQIDTSPKVDLTVQIPETPCSQQYIENHKTQIVTFPIVVMVDSNLREENIDLIILSINKWNERMETTVFTIKITDQPVDRKLCGTVFINDQPIPEFSEEYKQKTHTWVDKCSAEIRIENLSSFNNILHGLGHALNLKHDLNETSVMYEIPGIKITDMSKCLVGLALKEFLITKEVQNGEHL